MGRAFRFAQWVSGAALLVCVGAYVWGTRQWPPISDGVLMRYVDLLIQHGQVPYRDIVDLNMPGSYLFVALVDRVFGAGASGWRMADFALSAAAGAALVWLGGRKGVYPAMIVAGVFALLHGADGVAQINQRDFAMAVLALAGVSLFVRGAAMEGAAARLFSSAAAGLCWGAAITVKPQIAVVPPLVLGFAALRFRRARGAVSVCAVAVLCPPAAVLLRLGAQGALPAFFDVLTGLAPYHAGMARHSFGFLAGHAVPSQLLPLVLAAAVLRIWRPGQQSLREQALLVGVFAGFLSFVAQGKAYPYHRYPLILFLLAYLAAQLEQGLRPDANRRLRWVAGLAMLYAVAWLAPSSAEKALRYDWRTEPSLEQLAADLKQVKAADGKVQCLDTMAGCITALDRLRLVQSTGFLYDCYLFAPGRSPVKEEMRTRFWNEVTARPPEVFVVADQWCLNLPSGYGKLDTWPALKGLLATDYRLAVERSWPRGNWRYRATWPFGYRMYVRRSSSRGIR